MNIATRKLLDSKGSMMKKDSATIKELVEEFQKQSREYHNPREDVTRGKGSGNGASVDLAIVMENLKIWTRG